MVLVCVPLPVALACIIMCPLLFICPFVFSSCVSLALGVVQLGVMYSWNSFRVKL